MQTHYYDHNHNAPPLPMRRKPALDTTPTTPHTTASSSPSSYAPFTPQQQHHPYLDPPPPYSYSGPQHAQKSPGQALELIDLIDDYLGDYDDAPAQQQQGLTVGPGQSHLRQPSAIPEPITLNKQQTTTTVSTREVVVDHEHPPLLPPKAPERQQRPGTPRGQTTQGQTFQAYRPPAEKPPSLLELGEQALGRPVSRGAKGSETPRHEHPSVLQPGGGRGLSSPFHGRPQTANAQDGHHGKGQFQHHQQRHHGYGYGNENEGYQPSMLNIPSEKHRHDQQHSRNHNNLKVQTSMPALRPGPPLPSPSHLSPYPTPSPSAYASGPPSAAPRSPSSPIPPLPPRAATTGHGGRFGPPPGPGNSGYQQRPHTPLTPHSPYNPSSYNNTPTGSPSRNASAAPSPGPSGHFGNFGSAHGPTGNGAGPTYNGTAPLPGPPPGPPPRAATTTAAIPFPPPPPPGPPPQPLGAPGQHPHPQHVQGGTQYFPPPPPPPQRSPDRPQPHHAQTFPLQAKPQQQHPQLHHSKSLPQLQQQQSPKKDEAKGGFWSTALSETAYLASGLISHPFESTKHYTILRHSPSVIWHRGPKTTVTISVFSSPKYPLPKLPSLPPGAGIAGVNSDATGQGWSLWIQQRGFSGDSGMKLKNWLGGREDWVCVTPASLVKAEDLETGSAATSKRGLLSLGGATEERGWKRDIKRTEKKLKKEFGEKKGHIARFTAVVRVPEGCEDGYFRVHLCVNSDSPDDDEKKKKKKDANKKETEPKDPAELLEEQRKKMKVLCSSPIFRLASTSTDPSSIRGASLSTMPLEMGISLTSFIASEVISSKIAPIKDPITNLIDPYRANPIVEELGIMVTEEVKAAREEAEEEEQERLRELFGAMCLGGAAASMASTRGIESAPGQPVNNNGIIGPDSGPLPPLPIRFTGKVAPGTGRSTSEMGIPTANLTSLPEEIKHYFKGVYFGYARILPTKSCPVPPQPGGGSGPPHDTPWYEAIISSGPVPYAKKTAVVVDQQTTVYFIPSFPPGTTFFGSKLEVLVLGFLHPVLDYRDTTPQYRLDTAHRDVVTALSSLNRPNWTAQTTLQRLKAAENAAAATGEGERGGLLDGFRRNKVVEKGEEIKEKIAGAKEKVSKQIDRIPVHKVGIRKEDGRVRDRYFGTGGYWVPR
ncbi:hypothetical protein B0T20DRAFT_436724 [Sordaria brevicollis]|uniref:Riboflavin kinase n=1 Tax=Sordaria brevicollis TaxID=83679 RepID=A0AAE0PGK5_SORBR|nr:hypothetical protein B0T20DRAFT_436724 [Sordaria brevicollis]